MPLIQVQNLTLGYDSNTVAENINFSLNKGDYLCIVGENGAGKSTLIKSLLGLIKPKGGSIAFSDEKNIRIGYLPQQTEMQKDFPATVNEIVLSGCISALGARPFYSKSDKEKANLVMKEMSVFDLRKKVYRDLSGGQQQKVLLSRALCAAKELLIADEPAAGLDMHSCDEMYNIIKNLNTEKGMTIIMVTHDIMSALKYSTHILHIDRKENFFGTANDYKNSSLGADFIKKLGGDHK